MQVYFANCKQTAEKCNVTLASQTHFGYINVRSEMHIFWVIWAEIANFDLGHPTFVLETYILTWFLNAILCCDNFRETIFSWALFGGHTVKSSEARKIKKEKAQILFLMLFQNIFCSHSHFSANSWNSFCFTFRAKVLHTLFENCSFWVKLKEEPLFWWYCQK